MLYSFLGKLAKLIFLVINGRIRVRNKKNLPNGNYVLIAPHRTWFDPVVLAYAAEPKEFGFMAKKELYSNHLFKFILEHTHGIPVDREHPGPSIIKRPVRILQRTNLSIIIFPSGTRHSQKLKSGAALIAKLARVPLVPAVYQGPLTFRKLFTRKPITIAFGKSISVKELRLNDRGQAQIEIKMSRAFQQLDNSINPHFKYVDVSKK